MFYHIAAIFSRFFAVASSRTMAAKLGDGNIINLVRYEIEHEGTVFH